VQPNPRMQPTGRSGAGPRPGGTLLELPVELMRRSLDIGRSPRMLGLNRLLGVAVLSITLAGHLLGQAADSPRQLSTAQTGCDTSQRAATDSVYDFDMVDEPVQAERLPIEDMPLRVREVLSGRSVFRFIVEPSGRIDRCSIELVEESAQAWTEAVLKELRQARYHPARRGGQKVRQRVYQIFTYNQDGRLLHGR
jgi:hypothetical protein